jgi:hypothetical protein
MMKLIQKVLWLGRGTATLMGLAMLLAITVGLASTALAGTGVGARFDLGKANTVDRISQLVGSTDNALLRIDNDSKGADATALDLRTDPKKPPMKVDSFTKVERLNADLLDGQSADQFLPLGGKAFDSAGSTVSSLPRSALTGTRTSAGLAPSTPSRPSLCRQTARRVKRSSGEVP